MAKKRKGLTSKEVLDSRKKYGDNTLPKIKVKGIIKRFFENLSDPIIKVLMIALALELIFTFGNCNIVEILGIVTAILIATVVSTVSEYGSEKAFSKIEKENEECYIKVIRDGKISSIDSRELVVGDIVYIYSGEKVQADGSVLEGEVSVDQSALNGENTEVHKIKSNDKKFELSNSGKIFRGSVVTHGNCIMCVERVGKDTFYGMVAKDVQAETRESPLKVRLSTLAGQISKIGYFIAGLVAFTYLFNTFIANNGFEWWRIVRTFENGNFVFSTLIHALTLMITVIVVAVPEGLPMMITVVLSANMKRMVKDNILVKKLVGIETAGSLNILFTDKTGTLTCGALSCESFITMDSIYKKLSNLKDSKEIYKYLLWAAVYNTDSKRGEKSIIGGNSTDRAIGEYFFDCKVDKMEIKSYIPFNSEIKKSVVTFKNGITVIKGAAENILNTCKFAINNNGELCASDLSFAKKQYKEAVLRGERVIGVSMRDNEKNIDTFVCLIILKDKLRSGVKEAVKNVCGAGIQVVMVTGDSKDTAVSIAEECGIYKSKAGHIALTSKELENMNDEELEKILPDIRVVARALPQDKTRLVRICQNMNLVVGMTGDGINDAPSLKLADVGFAMGSGTDIAKSAGDIIILDDSFNAISKTTLYGRTIFKSIRKFITFQLIMNFAACGITLFGQFLGIENPITIIQMLWVNIIMDTLGGLAFAGEAPLGYYMKEKPKKRDEPILSKEIIKHIAFNGTYTLIILLIFLKCNLFRQFYSYSKGNLKLLTAFYAVFIFAGLANCFTARCERLWLFSSIGKNKPFLFIMGFISIIQILIIYYGGSLFRSTPLNFNEFFMAILVASSVFVFDFIRRIFQKLR